MVFSLFERRGPADRVDLEESSGLALRRRVSFAGGEGDVVSFRSWSQGSVSCLSSSIVNPAICSSDFSNSSLAL